MGYTTEFFGSFKLDKPLTAIQIEYLNMFADTRRMKRDPTKLHLMKQEGRGNTRCFELLEELGLPFGKAGDFYCGTGNSGQDTDCSIVGYNEAPPTQCGLWCKWNPNYNGTEIVWDGSEKFYHYTDWLEYLIKHFLAPWGYKLNGLVEWCGEDSGDIGVIEVVDNVVETHEDKTIKHLEDTRKDKPKIIATETNDFILDIVKLRNELSSSKKGTTVACKKLDALIAKYGV